MKRKAKVLLEECVACGSCVKVCPRGAIQVVKGMYANVEPELCVGCMACARACPASVIVEAPAEMEGAS
ncbi:MAG: 4Fe-4S binding protein [Fretibacterium sp.]|nr:4Fe-4S binding protein [Fretibacterium sp.]